jgi:hypothetical protein
MVGALPGRVGQSRVLRVRRVVREPCGVRQAQFGPAPQLFGHLGVATEAVGVLVQEQELEKPIDG